MNRQYFLAAGAACAAAAAPAVTAAAPVVAAATRSYLDDRLIALCAALPGIKAFEIRSEGPSARWSVSHNPKGVLFIGSCFKTFVLATYLQEIEKGRLSLDEFLDLDDRVRSISSPVFGQLDGKVAARFVLEEMIAHSDNTATDMAMRRVGVKNVRAFIASAGLANTRVPDDTRIFFSYLAGYPPGVDMGWKGCREVMAGRMRYPARPALNKVETMTSSPADLIAYYSRALRGDFFSKPETLVEFKRILSLADSIPHAVPPDTPAYMKGGSIDWKGFYTMASAGWMMLDALPVTFAILLNWTEKDGSQADVTARYIDTVRRMLTLVQQTIGT
jgi:beta-lactamase class A